MKDLIKSDAEVLAILNTEEAWDNINAIASQTTNDNTRTSQDVQEDAQKQRKRWGGHDGSRPRSKGNRRGGRRNRKTPG